MPARKLKKVRPVKKGRKPAREVKVAVRVNGRPVRSRVAKRVASVVKRAPAEKIVGRALRARRRVQARTPLVRLGREAVVAALPRVGRAMNEEE